MTGLLHKCAIVVVRHFIPINPKSFKGHETFGAFIKPALAGPLNKLPGRNKHHFFLDDRLGWVGGRRAGCLHGLDNLRKIGIRGRRLGST